MGRAGQATIYDMQHYTLMYSSSEGEFSVDESNTIDHDGQSEHHEFSDPATSEYGRTAAAVSE